MPPRQEGIGSVRLFLWQLPGANHHSRTVPAIARARVVIAGRGIAVASEHDSSSVAAERRRADDLGLRPSMTAVS
jgi:hypothetical protein